MGDAASQVFPAHGSGIGIGYDPLARRTSMGDGSGQSSWTYGYDQVGRSAAITTTGPSPLSFQYAYDARSLLTAATNGGLGGANGTVSYTHDSLGRVGGSGGGTPAYSPAGDLTQLDGASRARDVARQLCWTAPGLSQNGCANPPTGATVFTHDANGNRTLQQRPNGNRTRYLYDQAHRLTTARNEPQPKAAGALPALPDSPWLVLPTAGLLAAGWYVTRNSRRRMVLRTATGVTIAVLASACAPMPGPPGSTTLASYSYRGDGLLTTRTTPNGQADRFTWDDSGGTPALLQIGATSLIYGPDGQVVSRITGTVAVQLHTDRLGSVVAATNANGTRAASVAYTAWGAERSPSGDVGALGFTGEYTDPATGFVYLRARWYDPATAEFITRDPAEWLTGDPYAYAANSPLAFTDPLGLWPSWEDVKGVASGVGDWVVENRHTIIDVATTVGTVVAIGAVCGATAGVGCAVAVGVGAAAGGTLLHKGSDALVDDDRNDVSWGGAAGRSAVNAAVGATCALTFGQGCGPATLGRTTTAPRTALPFVTRWTYRTPQAVAATRWGAGSVWGASSLARWLLYDAAGWRCHGGLGVG